MMNTKSNVLGNNRNRFIAFFVLVLLFLPTTQRFITTLTESISGSQKYSGSYNWSNENYPIPLGKIEITKRGVLKMKFDFTLKESASEWPNLFQTADMNSGIRVEIRNGTVQGGTSTIGVIYSKNEVGDLEGVPITDNFIFGTPHELRIEAKQNAYLTTTLDGVSIKRESPAPIFKSDKILVGQGFNSDRKFSGEISNFEINYVQNEGQAKSFYYALNCLILLIILVCLRKDLKKFGSKNAE